MRQPNNRKRSYTSGSSVLFPRILRLTGVALEVGAIGAFATTTLLALDGSSSAEETRFLVISIILTFALGIIGIPLVAVGDKISPPDPWLDAWLSPFRLDKKHAGQKESTGQSGILATISTSSVQARQAGLRGKWSVRFEETHLFLEMPGKDDILVEVRKIVRTGDVTLLIDTGSFLSYGELTMTFDSASDTDIVEREARELARNR